MKEINAMSWYSMKHGEKHLIGGVVYFGTNPVYVDGKKIKKGIPFVKVS